MHIIKSRVPTPLKRKARMTAEALTRQVRRPFKEPTLRAALREIAADAPAAPSLATLERLVDGWDNPAAGDLDYMQAVVELARRADGPILECGSGLTTFLLAACADQPVWTLEADERWFRRVRAESTRAGLTAVHLVQAPLRDHGDFYWYELPPGLPETFSMVVCDGPAAGSLKGGRVGLMPVVGSRIASGAPVVVDAGMVYEHDVLAVWESDYGLVAEDAPTRHRVYRAP